MGFEINGMPILNNNFGMVNQTNTFKTAGGQSIQGSGNYVDAGNECFNYNAVGSFTIIACDIYYGIYNAGSNTGLPNQSDNVAFPASSLQTYYSSSYGGFSYSLNEGSFLPRNSTMHQLSGSWMMKTPRIGYPGNTGNYPALWQRIS